MSTHESVAHFSPYYLLFGRQPLLGRIVSKRLCELPKLDLDDEAAWVAGVTARAEAFKRELPMAMRSLEVAQARDRLGYAYTRGGLYRPKPKQYRVGDFVYVNWRATDTLDCSASQVILQVIQIKPDYTLVLRGRDGRVMTDHARNTARCYLPDVSDEYGPAKVRWEADHRCEVCRRVDSPGTMLLYDGCNLGYHMECLTPPMLEVPKGEWDNLNHLDRTGARSL